MKYVNGFDALILQLVFINLSDKLCLIDKVELSTLFFECNCPAKILTQYMLIVEYRPT